MSTLAVNEYDWVDVPEGEFINGEAGSEPDSSAARFQGATKVAAFKMLKTPVTFAMYDAFCDATGRKRPDDWGWGRGRRPIIEVSYWDAMDYTLWLSQQTGWSVRLPTSTEWEYACRAGTTKPFWTGKSITTAKANFLGYFNFTKKQDTLNRKMTTPVDLFRPNRWGLHDMHGNVYEWCTSELDLPYKGQENRDTVEDNAVPRALRGGAWNSTTNDLFSHHRRYERADLRTNFYGFRLIKM